MGLCRADTEIRTLCLGAISLGLAFSPHLCRRASIIHLPGLPAVPARGTSTRKPSICPSSCPAHQHRFRRSVLIVSSSWNSSVISVSSLCAHCPPYALENSEVRSAQGSHVSLTALVPCFWGCPKSGPHPLLKVLRVGGDEQGS